MAKNRNLNKRIRIRQLDDTLDELDELDELGRDERIRKQPHDNSQPTNKKTERRQRQKAWGRVFTHTRRKQKREGNDKP
jgi:TolA-binding protein